MLEYDPESCHLKPCKTSKTDPRVLSGKHFDSQVLLGGIQYMFINETGDIYSVGDFPDRKPY